MQSGKRRHKVTLERRTDTQAANGQVVHSYTPFADVYASIEPLTGREFFAAAQIQADITTKVKILWRGDVDETCRIAHIVSHDSPQVVDLYDIVAPLPDQKTNRKELVLMCTRRRAEGWRRGD